MSDSKKICLRKNISRLKREGLYKNIELAD